MISTQDVAKNYVTIGEKKAKMSKLKLFVLGILAGVFISVAGIGAATAAVSVHQESIAKLVTACVFPAGLAMVVLAGSELFTGNCLMIISVLEKRIKVVQMLRNWGIVYCGNLVGSIMFSWLCTHGHVYTVFNNGLANSLMSTAVSKTSMSFGDAFIKGILCNILVCVALWVSYSAVTVPGKIISLFIPIMVFVLCGFEHSIANMGYISSGLFMKTAYNMSAPEITWGSFFIGNLLPVTLGNILGGFFVGVTYWIAYLREDKNLV